MERADRCHEEYHPKIPPEDGQEAPQRKRTLSRLSKLIVTKFEGTARKALGQRDANRQATAQRIHSGSTRVTLVPWLPNPCETTPSKATNWNGGLVVQNTQVP